MRVLGSLLVLALCACADKDVARLTARVPAPSAITFTNHPLPGGTLSVIEVPITSMRLATERQTCFLWRDTDKGTASLQCPNDQRSYSVDPP